ncbi:LVIVD repeat-containing protein [Aureispira anguillae]|uniref:LVIVD repeat-containing protein n=1 Tax=Aureispira anguillae TaxID=2864201 RepID=A0A915YEI9_9BACT|nr:hypothetical protein [Aureispira anguillae]BDS11653.1 hypothetical protein AsAng_0023670 [Aureispira anguillae]
MYRKNVFFAAFCMLFLLVSCAKDDCTRVMTYTKHTPIYKSLDEIRVNPTVEPARELKNPGKIYLYGNLILINEKGEGVHVIDNANPASPNKLAFISIPGNIDIAMSGTTLYADNYIDLLAIDVSNIQDVRLKKRVEDAFPSYGSSAEGLLVAYDSEEVTEEIQCNDQVAIQNAQFGGMQNNPMAMNNVDMNNNTGGVSASVAGSGREAIGIGGSMARFAINGQNLYIVDEQNMNIYDITNAENPTPVNQVTIGMGWGIETIFPYGDKLFIGSNTGMYIYDNTNPQNPTYISEFQHATACDPVFVDGNFAYVTLRGGTNCQTFSNQLDVIDITNVLNPSLVSSTDMHNPHGLSVENDKLYLCDGSAGLKVFDVANKQNIGQNQLFHDASIATYDAITIPNANVLLVVGEDGFHQYNTSDPSNLQVLSHIPVAK